MNPRLSTIYLALTGILAATVFIGLIFAAVDDGVVWQFQFVDQGQSLNSVVWANGLYVAVGYEGDVVTTPDDHVRPAFVRIHERPL